MVSQPVTFSVILGLLSLFPLLVLAAPASPQNLQQRQVQGPPSVSNEECGFEGDDNTYGLGIRIGVYLQWITSALAYGFIPSEAQSIRGVNNCFQAAMFAGLLFITITKGPDLYAVEAYIMLIFCMGGVCSRDTKDGNGVFRPKKFAYYNASNIGGAIRFALSTGFCVYGLWFFFHGMDGMKETPCSTWAYFFAKVNLYTWLRTFMKVVFVFMGIIHAVMIFWPTFNLICGSHNQEVDEFDMELAQMGRVFEREPETPTSPKAKIGFESTSMVILSGSLISFVLTVELMINWNHINGVNQLGSTGQLLPLIVGIGSFLRVVHLYGREKSEDKAGSRDTDGSNTGTL